MDSRKISDQGRNYGHLEDQGSGQELGTPRRSIIRSGVEIWTPRRSMIRSGVELWTPGRSMIGGGTRDTRNISDQGRKPDTKTQKKFALS